MRRPTPRRRRSCRHPRRTRRRPGGAPAVRERRAGRVADHRDRIVEMSLVEEDEVRDIPAVSVEGRPAVTGEKVGGLVALEDEVDAGIMPTVPCVERTMDDRFPGPGPQTSLKGRAASAPCWTSLVAAIRRGESRSLVLRGRGRDREDGAAGVPGRVGVGPDRRAGGGRRVRDGAGLREPASAVRAAARSARAAARLRSATRCEIVFGLSGGPAPDRFLVGLAVLSLVSRGGRATSAAVRRRRRAVAGSGLGADARVRRSPAAGRAGGARVRGTRARRGAPARAGARGARPASTATPARC